MSLESSSPPLRTPRIPKFLPLSADDFSPLATKGHGVLSSLIRSQSNASLHTTNHRRPSSFRGRDTPDDEECGSLLAQHRDSRDEEREDFNRGEERRLSAVLNGPFARSQRLIGNSNPRYQWERYWKTEEEMKTMKKPMQAWFLILCYIG